MKFLIKLQREGWYFAGFRGPSGIAEIGKIQNAKIYNSRREAMSDLTRMGDYGQRIIAITQIGCETQRRDTPFPGNPSRKMSGTAH